MLVLPLHLIIFHFSPTSATLFTQHQPRVFVVRHHHGCTARTHDLQQEHKRQYSAIFERIMSSLESTKRSAENTTSPSDQGESKKAAMGDSTPVSTCPGDEKKVRAAYTLCFCVLSFKLWHGVAYSLGFPIWCRRRSAVQQTFFPHQPNCFPILLHSPLPPVSLSCLKA